MKTKKISIKSSSKRVIICDNIDLSRDDNRTTKSKVPFLGTPSLVLQNPRLREVFVEKGKASSFIVSLSFLENDLCIELVNSCMKHKPNTHIAFDGFTNRYPEYPAKFLLLGDDMISGEYFIKTSTDYRGDFLLLSSSWENTKRKEDIIINLSAIFMFDSSMIINSSGNFEYLGKLVQEHQVTDSSFMPFIGFFDKKDDLTKENFKNESFLLIQKWIPFMQDIQTVSALADNGRDRSESDNKSINKMKKYLKVLPKR